MKIVKTLEEARKFFLKDPERSVMVVNSWRRMRECKNIQEAETHMESV